MAVRARLGIRTAGEWHALPPEDREAWLVWQIWVERMTDELRNTLRGANSEEAEPENKLTPEAAVLLTLPRMGL